VPYKNKAQLIPGYQGLLTLARRSGELLKIVPRVVREGDHFRYAYGKNEILEHTPADDSDAPLTHVYAIAWIRGCPEPQFEVMTRKEVEKHRDRSKAKDSGPWRTDYEAMALKTVLRKLCKFLPASVELKRAVELDERADAGLPQDLPTIDAEYTEEPMPPDPDENGAGEGPPPQTDNGSDAPIASEPEPLTDTGVSSSGSGGDQICPGCERAWELINGSGDVPGMGHAPDCPEA
jgi:recombinational DNA repair protein RecT